MQHSVIAPSSAPEWFPCAASIVAQQGIDDADNSAREEGSALHEVARRVLLNEPFKLGDEVEGVIITKEMMERVQIYIDFINSTRGNDPRIETMIQIPRIHPECFGTADYWEYFPEKNLLVIADYKDGRISHTPVEHLQMICYMTGILDLLPQGAENTLQVRFVIVQPRSWGVDKVKSWMTTAVSLRALINQLAHAAGMCFVENPEEHAGTHCKYCKAKFDCESFNQSAENLIATALYTPEAVGTDLSIKIKILRMAEEMIGQLRVATEAKAMDAIKHGETVNGFTTGTGRGKLAWIKDLKGLDDLATAYGVKLSKEGRITPTQAKSKLKALKLPESVFKKFTVFHHGKTVLKTTSTTKAQEVFGGK